MIAPADPDKFAFTKLENTIYVQNQSQNNYAEKIEHYYWQTYYHVGKFKDAFSFRPRMESMQEYMERTSGPHKIRYMFNLLGFKRKAFYADTLPSYTSYSEVFLEPYLPVKPSQPNSQGDRTIGYLQVSNNRLRVFSLVNENARPTLKIKDVNKSEIGDYGLSRMGSTCRIGIVGQPTPDRFKHSLKAGLSQSDYELNGKSTIIKIDRKDNDGKLIMARLSDKETEVGLGAYLWNKYALNKNLAFKFANQPDFQSKDLKKGIRRSGRITSLQPGTIVEVLGRYQAGHIDELSKIARPCSPDESQENPRLCNNSLDRYLVSIPSKRDGSSIKNVGKPNKKGNKYGVYKNLYWVNVRDVDMLKPSDKLPVRKVGDPRQGKSAHELMANMHRCLRLTPNEVPSDIRSQSQTDTERREGRKYRYLSPAQINKYFYKHLETKKQSRKYFDLTAG